MGPSVSVGLASVCACGRCVYPSVSGEEVDGVQVPATCVAASARVCSDVCGRMRTYADVCCVQVLARFATSARRCYIVTYADVCGRADVCCVQVPARCATSARRCYKDQGCASSSALLVRRYAPLDCGRCVWHRASSCRSCVFPPTTRLSQEFGLELNTGMSLANLPRGQHFISSTTELCFKPA
jgi:hypothetical protein